MEGFSIEMKPEMSSACSSLLSNGGPCANVDAVDAAVIECLQDSRDHHDASAKCREELDVDLELTSKDYRLKFGISHVCSSDMQTLCPTELSDVNSDSPVHGGAVLSCLVKKRRDIESRDCVHEVKRYQKAVMENWKNSVEIKSACSEDVNIFCANVQAGHGAVHNCLTNHINHVHEGTGEGVVSPECAKAEFSLLEQKFEDIDLDEDIMGKCASELSKFCENQRDGEGGGMTCLERNVYSDDMSEGCREVVKEDIRLRNKDARLDIVFSRVCSADSAELCGPQPSNEPKIMMHEVIDCLIKQRDEVKRPGCKSAISKKIEQRTADWMADPDVAEACIDDVQNFCGDVLKMSGEGRVHECLFKNIAKLSNDCQLAEFKDQVIASENIKFNKRLYKSCARDLKRWCDEVEDVDKISCLQDHIEDDEISGGCLESIRAENEKEGQSIIFNPNLVKACKSTLMEFVQVGKEGCSDFDVDLLNPTKIAEFRANTMLYGIGLSCLTTNKADIKSAVCSNEVFNKEKVMNEDVNNRAGLKDACAADIMNFCQDVPRGEGKILRCLQDHVQKLSNKCKKEIVEVKNNQDNDIMLRPITKKRCSGEIKAFCRHAGHGDQEMYGCLKFNMDKEDFGAKCKVEISRVDVKSFIKPFDPISVWDGSNIADSSGSSETKGIVISGPLAVAAMFSLCVVLVLASYCIWKRRAQSRHNYSVVLPRDARDML